MINENKTADKLLEIAQKMADEKLAQEKQYLAKRISNELGDVKRAVEMVRSGLCYKKQKGISSRRYIFATEDMLINDYLSEPENSYTRKGLRFSDDCNRMPYDYIFCVNGIYYYDMRYILNAYEEDVKKEKNRITRCNDQLEEMTREFNRLLEENKAIKEMLDDWSKRHEESENSKNG